MSIYVLKNLYGAYYQRTGVWEYDLQGSELLLLSDVPKCIEMIVSTSAVKACDITHHRVSIALERIDHGQ